MGEVPYTTTSGQLGLLRPGPRWLHRHPRTNLDAEEASVPVVSTKEILDRAFTERYGVAAFNILDDLTIDAIIAAAEEERAPVILQTSVKTVRAYGRDRLIAVFRAMASDAAVPVAVHLDHCPYRDVITECLDAGWNSVLFDAHELDVAENLKQTTEVVGEAHGQYKSTPKLNHQRVTDLVEATGIPMALHGGTGLSADQFRDLISRGCAKVNISTAIKESYMKSGLEHLKGAEEKNKWDPPTL